MVEETDGSIERRSKRELETEMKRNEVRQRKSGGGGGEGERSRIEEEDGDCAGGGEEGVNKVFVTVLSQRD